jgi:hypothetical protein
LRTQARGCCLTGHKKPKQQHAGSLHRASFMPTWNNLLNWLNLRARAHGGEAAPPSPKPSAIIVPIEVKPEVGRMVSRLRRDALHHAVVLAIGPWLPHGVGGEKTEHHGRRWLL